MSYFIPEFRHPESPTNDIGYTRKDYEGAISTLCAGCGHDSISAAIIDACFQLSIEPHKVAKISGIGCSSKTPTYFLGNSHGFNSVHGRMPCVTTGARMANRDLTFIGVSGDGDSASIGMGQFVHVVRRNLNMMYIVENNGCYGLTKGQDSATADVGSVNKKGDSNIYEPIDLVISAISIGASFVARSFSGDKAQLVPLMKAALCHPGFAIIDVVSPCVTFNNHAGSTRSYEHMRDVMEETPVDFVPMKDEITTNYSEGTTEEVCMHDGSVIRLHKAGYDFNPRDRRSALRAIRDHKEKGQVLTGLLYLDPDSVDFHESLGTTSKPLNALSEDVLCPGAKFLDSINDGLR
jgi:2-oxoglutarate ferredoxin oxidoreductase subunit beta